MTERTAILYRKALPGYVCGHGLKAQALLKAEGFRITDHALDTEEAIAEAKARFGRDTLPHVVIGGADIGGYSDLAAYLGVADDPKTYRPVIALFSVAAALSIAVTWLVYGTALEGQTTLWFIAIAMVLLGLQKLQDIASFARMFQTYDLLAMRWPAYGQIYPFIETGAGLLMLAGVLTWVSAPLALVAAGIGAVSVFKAVYIDKRNLNCACVGGDSNVPLGFVSLLENLMMIGMAVYMLAMA